MIFNYLKSLSPASHNNSRAIVSSKYQRFERFPSERSAMDVEKITAGELQADFMDKDVSGGEHKPVWCDFMNFEITNAVEINMLN